MKRPEAKFTEEDGLQFVKKRLLEVLQEASEHSHYKRKNLNAQRITNVGRELAARTDCDEFRSFADVVAIQMWKVATSGDKKNLQSLQRESLVAGIHDLGTSTEVQSLWNSFCNAVDVTFTPYTLLNHVLRETLKDLISARTARDFRDHRPLDVEEEILSKEEEEVLRYVAGYLPYALLKRYRKKDGDEAKEMAEVVQSWKASEDKNNAKTFLEYSNNWIDAQNRGGLFVVNDDAYLFFRTLEGVSRKLLTQQDASSLVGVDIASLLLQKLKDKYLVNRYWDTITSGKVTGETGTKLFDVVLRYWTKLRVCTYIKVFIALAKQRDSKLSRRGAKSLRKELPSQGLPIQSLSH